VSFETAVHQWRAGLTRLDDAPPHQRIVADAAFGRYVREAVDYAGGRRMEAPRT
jgi:hypothetical protein